MRSRKLFLFLHHRKQAGAAAVRLAEGEAEVAEAGVADFERGFGHVVFAGAEQFRRAIHAEALQVLRDRRAGRLREGAAEVKRAAPDFLAELLQRRRIRKITAQDGDDAFGALLGEAMLACAEKFRVAGLKEQLRHQLRRLALIPQALRRRRDGRIAQALHELLLMCVERQRGTDAGDIALAADDGAKERMQRRFLSGEVAGEKFRGEFDGDELVVFARRARRLQRLCAATIEACGHGRELRLGPAPAHGAVTSEVEANLGAAFVKTARPINRLLRFKVVPLEAHAEFAETAIKLTPTRADGTPSRRFFAGEGGDVGCGGLSGGHFQGGNSR